MCNQWCLEFSTRALRHLGSPTRMLEVGSLDVNGTVRAVLGHAVASYYGVDIRPGPGVDEVLDVARLSDRFGPRAFDLVTSTEMLEHCFDWQDALFQMLNVLRPGGLLLLTTRSPGFPLHDHPADHWRFGRGELTGLLEPVATVLEVEDDFSLGWPCGIGVVVRRREDGPPLDKWLSGLRGLRMVPVDPRRDAFSPNNSHFLPFHEYTAYRACADAIESMGLGRTRVVDLSAGGASRLVVCAPGLDVSHHPPGDGPPTSDFDCAVAVDTCEGLPRAGREALLETAARAGHAVIVAGRFAESGGAGRFAESGDLPSLAETVAQLERRGFAVTHRANGHTPWTVPLTELWRRSQERPGVLKAEVAPLLADANRRFAPLDFLEPALRRVVVGVRGIPAPVLPAPSIDAYREAGRLTAEWWASAAPLFDRMARP